MSLHERNGQPEQRAFVACEPATGRFGRGWRALTSSASLVTGLAATGGRSVDRVGSQLFFSNHQRSSSPTASTPPPVRVQPAANQVDHVRLGYPSLCDLSHSSSLTITDASIPADDSETESQATKVASSPPKKPVVISKPVKNKWEGEDEDDDGPAVCLPCVISSGTAYIIFA